MQSIAAVLKANPYKDSAGRWTSKDKAVSPGSRKEQYTPAQKAQLRDLMARTKKMPPGIRADAKLTGDPVLMKDLTDYLTIVGRSGGRVEAFVLKHGEEFKVPDTAPPIKLMTPKECYSNSALQSTAMGGKLGYAEGWVYPQGLIPIEHAWNYDLKTGEVIDHTMGWNPKSAYFGVKIPDNKLRRQLATSGVYGALRSDWRESDLVKNWDAK